jgi:DnaK suppressor protein
MEPDQKRKTVIQAETETIRGILKAKQMELFGSLQKRDDIIIERASDTLDQVQSMGERELVICNLDRDSKSLAQIRRALSRIATGTYGICLNCEEAILPKRLAAVPWAALCLSCQEQFDRHEIEVNETMEPLASAA